MQIVIDISEDDYIKVQDGRASVSMMRKAIINGAPLPKGHWEWVQYDYNPNIGNWHCSECRIIVVEGVKNKISGVPMYKYCPNCGAKMMAESEVKG